MEDSFKEQHKILSLSFSLCWSWKEYIIRRMFKQAKGKVPLYFESRNCSIPVTELFQRQGKKVLLLELKT